MNRSATITLDPHSVIVFQGNSITDAGRNRLQMEANALPGLGQGYPRLIAQQLLGQDPENHYQIYNRGVSGDTLPDLVQRWEQDTLPLLPDLVSVLIGVNDLWQALNTVGKLDLNRFQALYRGLLETTRRACPYTRLVLCEPFLLPVGGTPDAWMGDVRELGKVTRTLAADFSAVFVPFQQALDRTAAATEPRNLLSDGVHPTPHGHRVLAECWLEHVLGNERAGEVE